MTSIKLCPAELMALSGLPFAAVALYVLAMRPRMDYRTGMLGNAPRISWHALSEWCRVESRQGVAEERLSEWQLRRLADHLERAGLVDRRSATNERTGTLVFRLPLADRDSSVQKNPAGISAGKSAGVPQREEHPNPAGMSAGKSAGHPEPRFSKETSSSSSTSVDVETVADDDDDEPGLIYPQTLTPSQKASAARKVRSLQKGVRQRAIDELTGYLIARSSQGNPIRSPLAYLERIITSAQAAGWEPAHADEIAARREAAIRARETAPATPHAAGGAPRVRGEGAAGAIASLKAQLMRKP